VSLLAAGPNPVIPNFGTPPGGAHGCIARNGTFCSLWVREHWHDTLQPAIVQHLVMTLIAVAIGFAIAFGAALAAHRYGWFERPFGLFAAFLYTVPSIALFQLLVPFTGLTRTTIEIGLVGYTLLILFRNTLEGLRNVPPDVLEAARGMGLTVRQTLWRVELPLAMPAIMAGIRVATVTTISLATVAAFIGVGGLGEPIFNAIQDGFKTQFIAAGVLAVLLALVTDALLVVLQRVLSPWARTRAA
jgi:osmoprotectant transport system permease protein